MAPAATHRAVGQPVSGSTALLSASPAPTRKPIASSAPRPHSVAMSSKANVRSLRKARYEPTTNTDPSRESVAENTMAPLSSCSFDAENSGFAEEGSQSAISRVKLCFG
jgi:hypothetical protein